MLRLLWGQKRKGLGIEVYQVCNLFIDVWFGIWGPKAWGLGCGGGLGLQSNDVCGGNGLGVEI